MSHFWVRDRLGTIIDTFTTFADAFTYADMLNHLDGLGHIVSTVGRIPRAWLHPFED